MPGSTLILASVLYPGSEMVKSPVLSSDREVSMVPLFTLRRKFCDFPSDIKVIPVLLIESGIPVTFTWKLISSRTIDDVFIFCAKQEAVSIRKNRTGFKRYRFNYLLVRFLFEGKYKLPEEKIKNIFYNFVLILNGY